MRKFIKDALIAVTLAGIIPGVIIKLAGRKADTQSNLDCDILASTQMDTLQTSVPVQENSIGIPVLMRDDSVSILDLDAYVTAVVLREMPANFEMEALKAQAVVARTYALRQKANGSKHDSGAICTEASCCQGFCTQAEYLLNGGNITDIDRIRTAVAATKGEVLTYEETLIEATYFSCSGGKTETAESVWGTDIPYLQSVMSPGEENATHYTDTVTISSDKFAEKLALHTTGIPETWIGEIVYTEGDGIKTIEICGQVFTGTQIRQRLDLRSTSFIITAVGSTITITTKGFGHRVGMSQYGADAMAVLGHDYRQILSHYYQGTALQQYHQAD